MHRVLFVTLMAAALLIAPAASAETYVGLRLLGDGTFNGDLEPIPDAGFYTAREFVVGFGNEIQGEFSLGFDSISTERCDDDDVDPERGDFDSYDTVKYKLLTLGAAGFYPIKGEAGGNRIDVGLRFRYLSASWEDATDYYGRSETDEENEYGVSGWSIGPVMRAQWRCCNDRIGIGPEVGIKYGSYTATATYTYPGSDPYEYPDHTISGGNLEYSLRFDFFFDPK